MLSWVRTKSNPETWRLGRLRNGQLTATRAEVQKLPSGTWFWQRWEISGGDRFTRGHAGGDAGSRREAMQAAASNLETCIAAPEGSLAK